jgi:hypothetical protein
MLRTTDGAGGGLTRKSRGILRGRTPEHLAKMRFVLHKVIFPLREALRVGRIIPPKSSQLDTTKQLSLRVPGEIIDQLDEIAELEGYSRTEIVTFLLRWVIQEYRDERARELQTQTPSSNGSGRR